MTSPAPLYAVKKARRDRLIQVAARHSDWVLGFLDEVWWNRLSRPSLSTWTAGAPLKLPVLKVADDDPDPVSFCCYGMLRNDSHHVMLRFVDGRPQGGFTAQFLAWLSEELQCEGKRRLIIIWDDASWHACQEVLACLKEHNRRAREREGVEIIHFELPTKSPWLNNIEPCWQHARKAIMEPDRTLNVQETRERVCGHFGCRLLPDLKAEDSPDFSNEIPF
jgi:transposase